jgi:hypothetical protein
MTLSVWTRIDRWSRTSRLSTVPAYDGREIQGAHLRRHDPSRETVDVEEILEQPVELARVHRQPADQLLLVLYGQGLLEGEREPEYRRQRAPELVRDGSEERVLHPVDRPQAFGGLAFAPLALTQGALGQLAR